MACARVHNDVGHHGHPPRDPRVYGPRHATTNKNGAGVESGLHYCNSESQVAFLPFFMGTGSAFFTGRGSTSTFSNVTIFSARGLNPASCDCAYSAANRL